jgi:RNA polymerase sigma-70 factor (ECF subfamily)
LLAETLVAEKKNLEKVLQLRGQHREKVGAARVDDTQLIRGAQLGDAAAFEELVRQYDRAVLRLAVHLTGSQEDGQDIYQEAFLRAYINIGSFRFECSFYTWIYRIVTNLCLDHLRKRSSRYRDLTTTISSDGEEEQVLDRIPDQRAGSSPERNMASSELRGCIVRAMQRLSPRERVVFELKHYHGLRLRTVASILHTSEGTIKNTLFRATHKLRTQLAAVR